MTYEKKLMKPKKVVLVVNISTQFRVLLPVAVLLQKTSNYEPVFLLDDSIHNLDNEQDICDQHQIAYLKLPSFDIPYSPIRQRLYEGIKSRRIFGALLFFADILKTTSYFRKKVRNRQQFLQKEGFQLMIITEDGISYDIPFLVRAANKLKVVSVVIPFTIANALEPAVSLSNAGGKFEVQGIRKKITAWLFPHWVYTFNNKRLLRTEDKVVFALELTRMAPPIPWMYNSGHATVLVMESKFIEQYHLNEGIAANKMQTIGALHLDTLGEISHNKEALRQGVINERQLEPGKTWVLCSLPPDFRPNDIYSTYEEMVTDWIKVLCANAQTQVFVSLHPRTKKEKVAFIEDMGAIIISDPIEYMIPLCDVFVACISATIRIAVACGLPVVNYDVFSYRYSDYDSIEGVKTVFNRDDFQQEVDKMLTNPAHTEALVQYYQKAGDYYGSLDGKSHERLLNLFDELT